MEKKTASAIMLTLLLTSMLTLAFNIQPVKASGTIYIRADGSIDPPDAPISTVNNVTYTFTDNIYDSIVVERGNIMVDGAGYTLQGTGSGYGFYWSGINNVTIKNTNIEGFYCGIRLSSSSNNSISGNNIANNRAGIWLHSSNNNSISGNTFFKNGLSVWYSYDNVVVDNLVNGKPLVYLEGVSDYTVDNAGQVVLVNCNNILVENLNLSQTDVGVELWGTNNTKIGGNNITANNEDGIRLYSSNNNSISGNNITANNWIGVSLGHSDSNTIKRNNITNSGDKGIMLGSSNNNLLVDNIASKTTYGIELSASNNNVLVGNTASNNRWSGISLGGNSNSNVIYHNNFIDNIGWQAYLPVYPKSYNNTWDVGYPTGGNYWSDYTGLDANGDGIGDTPYVIDADNQDRYPLMHPSSPLPVHNMNTGLGYVAIQEAINANETLDGHTIFVEAGIYREHVSVNKTINLIGESRVVTIIDGYEVDVTANNVAVSGFAIGGFTAFAEGKKGNGIRLEADGCTVDNNTIFNASPYGVWLLNSTNNVISNNVMIANDYNMRLDESSNNTISQNYIGSIEWEGGIRLVYGGIELYHSSNNTITQNNVTQCQRAIRMEGVIPPGELQSDSSNNTIIENNIEHWDGGILLSDCSNNTILKNNITYLGRWRGKIEDSTGVSLYRSFNNMIIKNNIEQNGEGVKLVDSSLNNITDNNLTENFYGMLLEGSQVNSLIGNKIAHSPVIFEGSNETGRVGIGILISYPYYSNLLRNNSIAGYMYNFGVENGYYFQDIDASNTVDGRPIYYWVNRQNGEIPSDAGYVAIINSTNIRVEGLNLKNNYQGIFIAYSNNVTICENNITNSYIGLYLGSELGNNIIYHNNFISNMQQVYFYQPSSNIWDDGYPSGGNYWSDYVGVDVKSGPNQDLPGSDCIGDTPYIIDADNQDRYPLMKLWTLMPTVYTFSIVWEEETFTVSVASNSTVFNFAFNQPNKEISFYVTGPDGTIGFSNVTIPKQFLYGEPWSALIDGISVTPTIAENETHSILYFTYIHSTHKIQIIGTYVIAPPPPPLSVSISPLSASILVGQSVTFTSTVSGGYTPYSYQWYLNGAPVSGATAASWTFTPTSSGIYYVHLKVTDAKGNTAQSETARITVTAVPVGGYSFPIQVQTKTEPIIPYIALIATLTAILTKLRPKTKRKR